MAAHLALIDDALVRLARRKIRRLIIEMPPRHGKSMLSSIFFPAWYLGTFPQRKVILTSATEDLALDFSEQARDVLLEHGPDIFGMKVRREAKSKAIWKTDQGGMLRAAGVGGSIMGRGADLLIIDDYFKNVADAINEKEREKLYQWFLSTSRTRLMPQGCIVLIATRWHAKDLIGKVLETADRMGQKWERIRMAAICDQEEGDALGRKVGEALWESQFSKDVLMEYRKEYYESGYPWMWEALYQQIPPSVLDSEFNADYFVDEDYFDTFPEEKRHRWRVMSLDPSLGKNDKSDYSVWTKGVLDWDGTMWVDADIQRRDSMQICEDGVKQILEFRPHAVFVESVSFQEVLQREFERYCKEAGLMTPIYGFSQKENKLTRIRATLTPHLARHNFRWKKRSPGISLLMEQLKGFPTTKHDDGPDALEMLVRGFSYISANGVEEDAGDWRDPIAEDGPHISIPETGITVAT